MVVLKFTLTPEASSRLHDILSCLAKFSDTVSIEAQKEYLTLSALNSSQSAYASFILDRQYFSAFEFAPDNRGDGRFTCSIPNKALISVFKARITDTRGRETAIDRCEVNVQDQADEMQCRFIIRMICNHGVTKTYKLTYESTEVMHALFDKSIANNRWKIRSPFLKEFAEYFGPKAEQLDIYFEEGKVTFLSFTDKIISSKNEILKHPLKTAVAVSVSDFEQFEAQEKLHIIISVKDFKSIVNHADTLQNTVINAYYSSPGRPLQFSYSKDGIQCQFTLMTTGEHNTTPAPSIAPPSAAREAPQPTAYKYPEVPRPVSFRAASTTSTLSESEPILVNGRPVPDPVRYNTQGVLQPKTVGSESTMSTKSAVEVMPPPGKPAPRRPVRKLGQNENSVASQLRKEQEEDPDSLFVPAGEEDRRWDPADYENEEETLGWDASASNDHNFHPTFRDSSTAATRSHTTETERPAGLPATQRISQLQENFGLW